MVDETEKVEMVVPPVRCETVNVSVPPAAPVLTKRERVWLKAWCSVIPCKGVTDSQATRLADNCLKDFEERFKPTT